MLVGKYKGSKVNEAKNLVRSDMMASNEAASYYEPEGIIISRSGGPF
jgi:leucyl-tRNA synthetase